MTKLKVKLIKPKRQLLAALGGDPDATGGDCIRIELVKRGHLLEMVDFVINEQGGDGDFWMDFDTLTHLADEATVLEMFRPFTTTTVIIIIISSSTKSDRIRMCTLARHFSAVLCHFYFIFYVAVEIIRENKIGAAKKMGKGKFTWLVRLLVFSN